MSYCYCDRCADWSDMCAAKGTEIEALKRQRDDWMKVSHAWEDNVTKLSEENEALKRERDGLLDWSIESMGAQRYRDLLATIAEQAKLIKRQRATLENIRDWAEEAYFKARTFIDENVPGWVRGDDGPIYRVIAISQLAARALEAKGGTK